MTAQPHDKLFKEVFGEKRYAISHFRSFLPAGLVAALDLDNAERCQGSFVDEELRGHHVDLLYKIPWRDDETDSKADSARPAMLCYLLFEHQSSEDAALPLRMLSYSLRIWKDWLKDNPISAGLPVIFPLVLYHGPHGWRSSVRFHDYFAIPNDLVEILGPHIPQHELLLTDLSRYSDDELRSGTLDAVTRLLFKHISNEPEALLEHIINHFDLVERTFAEPSGLKSVLLVLEYVLKASDIAEQEVVRLSRRLSSKVEKEIMTTAERLREEGWKKGLETGLEQGLEQGLERGLEKGQLTGKQQILIRLLRLKFGEIGDTCTSAVEGMNEAELDNAAARVLTAESLDELFK